MKWNRKERKRRKEKKRKGESVFYLRWIGVLVFLSWRKKRRKREQRPLNRPLYMWVGYMSVFLVPEFMGLQGECELNKSMKAHRGPSVVVGYEKKEMKNLLSFVGRSVGWSKDGCCWACWMVCVKQREREREKREGDWRNSPCVCMKI